MWFWVTCLGWCPRVDRVVGTDPAAQQVKGGPGTVWGHVRLGLWGPKRGLSLRTKGGTDSSPRTGSFGAPRGRLEAAASSPGPPGSYVSLSWLPHLLWVCWAAQGVTASQPPFSAWARARRLREGPESQHTVASGRLGKQPSQQGSSFHFCFRN